MTHTVIEFPRVNREKESRVTKVPAYVRKLSSSLMWTLQIKEGVDLVYIVGDGDEYSNQRAIESWLMVHYTEDEVNSLEFPLDALEDALIRCISGYQYNWWEAMPC